MANKHKQNNPIADHDDVKDTFIRTWRMVTKTWGLSRWWIHKVGVHYFRDIGHKMNG